LNFERILTTARNAVKRSIKLEFIESGRIGCMN
jgi:hypothetical protein